MSAWKWCSCPGIGKLHCGAGCKEPLRLYSANIVEYQNSHWHLHCLLDKLTSEVPAPFNPYAGIMGQ